MLVGDCLTGFPCSVLKLKSHVTPSPHVEKGPGDEANRKPFCKKGKEREIIISTHMATPASISADCQKKEGNYNFLPEKEK